MQEQLAQGLLFITLRRKLRVKVSSEIPCRVSSDPHERFNDLATVLRKDPAKLQWLWRCGQLTPGQKDPVELYCSLTLFQLLGLCSVGGSLRTPMKHHPSWWLQLTVCPNKKRETGQCLVGSLTGAVASKKVTEACKGRLNSYRNGA